MLADGELLLAADLADAGQLTVVQVVEDRGLLQQIEVHSVEGMGLQREEQVKPWVRRGDLLTALRLPLAAACAVVQAPAWAVVLLWAAACSGFYAGLLGR